MPTPNSDNISADKQQHRYPLTGLLMLGLMGLILLGRMTGISLFDKVGIVGTRIAGVGYVVVILAPY